VLGVARPERTGWKTPYVGRFACDWHRLVGPVRAGVHLRDMSGP
jgi:hypothetical protein